LWHFIPVLLTRIGAQTQKPEKSPVSIAKDQALLEFQENGETKYYVISDIEERK
jgi:hypothetical protein